MVMQAILHNLYRLHSTAAFVSLKCKLWMSSKHQYNEAAPLVTEANGMRLNAAC